MSLKQHHTSTIKAATVDDVPIILGFIKELAEYEKLSHEVVATEELLRETLFGERQVGEIIIGYSDDQPVGFALFFHNFSTFLGRPGIYLEDLYVKSDFRGNGMGRKLLQYIATLAKERQCGRVEWSVLDWNEPSIKFYQSLGAKPLDDWTTFRLTGDSLEQLAAETA
jgi:GNAT superfamily N-acetyltransferase